MTKTKKTKKAADLTRQRISHDQQAYRQGKKAYRELLKKYEQFDPDAQAEKLNPYSCEEENPAIGAHQEWLQGFWDASDEHCERLGQV